MHASLILLPFSWLFGLVVFLRNKAFDWRLLSIRRAGVPVISVGNLTAGGTGKTPLVEYIVNYLLSSGKRVAVVSRGYGRHSAGVVVVSDGKSVLADARIGGDEPVQIARKFPSACVVVGEKRIQAARAAIEQCSAEVVVLDDGFQHRYLHRDLDIVVVNARNDVTQEPMLPAGLRRECLSELRRADVIAMSKVGSISDALEKGARLRRWYQGPLPAYRYKQAGIVSLRDQKPVAIKEIAGLPALAFSGTGDNGGFVQDLRNMQFMVKETIGFHDHHEYSPADVRTILEVAKTSGAKFAITTEKDATRLLASDALHAFRRENLPVYYLCIGLEMLQGEGILTDRIDRVCGGEAD